MSNGPGGHRSLRRLIGSGRRRGYVGRFGAGHGGRSAVPTGSCSAEGAIGGHHQQLGASDGLGHIEVAACFQHMRRSFTVACAVRATMGRS